MRDGVATRPSDRRIGRYLVGGVLGSGGMATVRAGKLVGPAGFVSMEDGCVGGFVQRGIAAAGDQVSAIEMGGRTAESQATRATEASVRGFWKAYRRHMGY